jgi:hypothetical protein
LLYYEINKKKAESINTRNKNFFITEYLRLRNIDPNLPDNLRECPFAHTCSLPINQHSCNFPEYKVCPEYQIKLKKLKSPSEVVH